MTASPGKRGERYGTLVFAGTLVIAAIVFHRPLLAWFGAGEMGDATAPDRVAPSAAPPGSGEAKEPDAVHHYTCSMHPTVKQQAPGKCPICGMDLTPVSNSQQEQGVVVLDETRRQIIGVRIEPVVEAPMTRTFRAVGRVTYDESALADVSLKVSGWITELLVSKTGQHVRRGEPLFRVYSPDLYSAEQDFLLANRGGAARGGSPGAAPNRMESLQRAARQRLRLLGVTDAQIDELARRGVPSESVAFASPVTGFVIEKYVVQGAAVEAAVRLYRIAGLDDVWVEADVYEADLGHVRVGQPASVTLDYWPGRTYSATVAYIYPALDPATRTGRVRLVLRNPKLELRPGMYATVNLASDVGRRVQVPASAVVYTGPRRLIFVDLGEGRFRPQEVQLGAESSGMYEVLSGLAPGDRVATSGVFLIAAEARITTATQYWDKAADPVGTSPDTAAPPAGAPAPAAPRVVPRAMVEKGAGSMSMSPPEPAFTCPMHPEVRSDAPGKCPRCGMDLVEAAPARAK